MTEETRRRRGREEGEGGVGGWGAIRFTIGAAGLSLSVALCSPRCLFVMLNHFYICIQIDHSIDKQTDRFKEREREREGYA